MIITSKLKLGENVYEFESDEKDAFDSLHEAIVFSNPPRECAECHNTDRTKMYFTTNKDKQGNTYNNVKCVCGARAKLSKLKVGGYFWHPFETYTGTPQPTDDEQ